MNPSAPIAIFDSGVGGLTVARQISRALPREHIVYLGDTARVPYGSKSPATVRRFAEECVEFLLHFQPKLLVIACNTASATAFSYLQGLIDVPLLEVIQPGARAAVGATTLGRVGVIGTRATIASGAYAAAIAAVDPAVEVVSAACPLFVPMVEEGRNSGPIVKAIAAEYLRPLLAKHVDTLILGCTHYPVLKPTLQEVVGGGVTLVDSAEAVATAATELLSARAGARAEEGAASQFYVTDTPGDFEEVARNIWPDWTGRAVRVELGRTSLR